MAVAGNGVQRDFYVVVFLRAVCVWCAVTNQKSEQVEGGRTGGSEHPQRSFSLVMAAGDANRRGNGPDNILIEILHQEIGLQAWREEDPPLSGSRH